MTRRVANPESGEEWGVLEHLVASLIDAQNTSNYLQIRLATGKRIRRPEPVMRPGSRRRRLGAAELAAAFRDFRRRHDVRKATHGS